MKKLFVQIIFAAAVLLFFTTCIWAQLSDMSPCDVTLKMDGKVIGSYKGLNVRITANKSDFLAHSFFISFDDLNALAKKRGVECMYDAAAKKLKVGKESLVAIAPDPKSTDTFAFGKVRMVSYRGKPYFDFVGLWSGLRFNSYSKTNDGYSVRESTKR
jgi:hypothetical protein